MAMNPEVKARWVAALRSGEYKQGHETLKNGGEFCCLGVLCDLYQSDKGGQWAGSSGFCDAIDQWRENYPPADVLQWAGLEDHTGGNVSIGGVRDVLPNHNDSGRSFAEIADAIEAQL